MRAIRAIDEAGNKYGRLIAIKREGTTPCGHATWLCKCECGNYRIVRGQDLRSSKTNSCGCAKANIFLPRLPKGEAGLVRVIRQFKNGADKRGYEWSLTDEQVRLLTENRCHYCGTEPRMLSTGGRYSDGNYVYNGIDRVDNDKGYTTGNVVPCCGDCNRAKWKMSQEQFKAWITKAYRHYVE